MGDQKMPIDPGYAEVLKIQAEKAFTKILQTLPYNNNSVYCRIHLKNSRCNLYIPIRNNLVDRAQEAKVFYEELANAAEL